MLYAAIPVIPRFVLMMAKSDACGIERLYHDHEPGLTACRRSLLVKSKRMSILVRRMSYFRSVCRSNHPIVGPSLTHTRTMSMLVVVVEMCLINEKQEMVLTSTPPPSV